MASFEIEGIGNLDPIDFGEPTPETRMRFVRALDSLKNLAVGKSTSQVQDIIGDADPRSVFGVSRDDLCPITEYSYDQISDPLFGPSENVYIMFQLADGDPDKFHNWKDILRYHSLSSIHYEGEGVEIYYDRSFTSEALYITKAHDQSMSIFSDDFQPMMLERVTRHMQAVNVGASKPTEGGMKRLIEVLEQEIAKRIVSD